MIIEYLDNKTMNEINKKELFNSILIIWKTFRQ